MRLTAKAITAELHQLGHDARLESGDGFQLLHKLQVNEISGTQI
jgi:hypothetical protein